MSSLEVRRKSVHIISGIVITYIILSFQRDLLLILTFLGLFITLLIAYSVKKGVKVPVIDRVLQSCEREDAMMKLPGKGVLMFTLSLLILLLVVQDTVLIAAAVLTLALGDGFATIVGLRWGKHTLIGKKSVEGSLAFFFASLIGLLLLLKPEYAILAALSGMLIELIPQEIVDDNITIPIGVGLILMMVGRVGGGSPLI